MSRLDRSLLRWAPLAPALCLALPALARVGGGQSFSGGHSHSSGVGGGNGGGFDIQLLWLLVQFTFRHPLVGVPIAGLVLFLVVRRSAPVVSDEASSPQSLDDLELPPPGPSARGGLLELLRPADPDFSLVLFEDFLYGLYCATQEARAGGKLDSLSPFLSDAARRTSDVSRPARIEAVIVGGLHLLDAAPVRGSPFVQVRVRFEANYTETATDGHQQTFYSVELWTLRRALSARSRPPDKTKVFACPSCGAPLEGVIAGKCSYCGKEVATGEHDWLVDQVEMVEREAREPALLAGGDPPEISPAARVSEGTDRRLHALEARDPGFSFEAFRSRVEMIFQELQAAWSQRDWTRARPFTSDRLFNEWAHWMDLYRRAHARNVVDQPRLGRLDLADVQSDRWYDAVTCRLVATCVDYTVSDDGRLLAGDRTADRPFSEYWTLIRGTGAKGRLSSEKKCPSCGSDLRINMAGRCEYCKAEVTSGAFDWVLSRIEQDEAYDP